MPIKRGWLSVLAKLDSNFQSIDRAAHAPGLGGSPFPSDEDHLSVHQCNLT